MFGWIRSSAVHEMADDEKKIGQGYRKWQSLVPAAIIGLTWREGDTKDLIAVGLFLGFYYLDQIEARLFDLCVRIRRTNLLLSAPKERVDNF